MPIVVSVSFVSAQTASGRLGGEPIGVPDTEPVCLVTLSGTFQGNSPAMGHPLVYNDGELVFDAYTGNLLVSSVGGL